jgi:hypothetical protein
MGLAQILALLMHLSLLAKVGGGVMGAGAGRAGVEERWRQGDRGRTEMRLPGAS